MSSARIDIEDTGPALDAIAAHAFGEAWATMYPGKQALAKQELLDLLLPGLQVILDQANEQMAAGSGEQRDAVLALHKPRPTDLITREECVEEECDHSDGCPTEPSAVCDHCFGMFERHLDEYAYERISTEVLYPCPTARLYGVTP